MSSRPLRYSVSKRIAVAAFGALLLAACATKNDPPADQPAAATSQAITAEASAAAPEGQVAAEAGQLPLADDEVEITKEAEVEITDTAKKAAAKAAEKAADAKDDASSAPPRPNVEPPEFAGLLAAHNHWRKQVGTPALAWSNSAADVAQAWADELARRDCKVSHSPGEERRLTWGENVFSYWRGGAYEGYHKTPENVVDRWASEGQWYDNKTQTCKAPHGSVCGHFTQVISTYSTHVGCGRARCSTAEVWVCNYSPPGNYKGVPPY